MARGRETIGRKSLSLRGGLAVAGGGLGVVGGVIGGVRGLVMVGLLISANEIVLPGLTAKCRDVERTPEMSVSGQEKTIGNFFFFLM